MDKYYFSGQELEDRAGTILRWLCRREEKPVVTDVRIPDPAELVDKHRSIYADFLLEEGCKALGINDPTVVEVKPRLTENSIHQFRLITDYYHWSLLVITLESTDWTVLKEITLPEKPIKILSYDALYACASKLGYRPKEKDRDNDEEKPLVNLATDPIGYNKKVIEKASDYFQRRKITLFLGAGVSSSAGLPMWDNLLRNILSSNHQTPLTEDDYLPLLVGSYNSQIIAARHLFTPFEKEINSPEILRLLHDGLYKNYHPKPNGAHPTLIDTIVDMSVNPDDKIPKEGLSIITFNFDDLIEEEMDRRQIPYQQFVGEVIAEVGKVPVIHVHGILRHKFTNNSGNLVLSENAYHQLYKSSIHWSNIEVEYALYRTTCIFIGLSMSDPNLRRLLDFVASEHNNSKPHFAIIEQKSLKDNNLNSKKPIPNYFPTPDQEREYIRRQETVFKDMGVNVIWYKAGQYNDVITILRSIAGLK